MKLFYSPTSPFVRKVVAVAQEAGVSDRIERVPGAAHPINRDQSIAAHNPLGQVPTLVLDDGTMLADSRVICEYLDDLGGGRLFPRSGQARWRALTDQAIGDGALTAAVLTRYEGFVRPEERRWPEWIGGQLAKVHAALAFIEKGAAEFGDRVDIGTITLACVLGYLDLRYADLRWREKHPRAAEWFARFDERPAMRETRLTDPTAAR